MVAYITNIVLISIIITIIMGTAKIFIQESYQSQSMYFIYKKALTYTLCVCFCRGMSTSFSPLFFCESYLGLSLKLLILFFFNFPSSFSFICDFRKSCKIQIVCTFITIVLVVRKMGNISKKGFYFLMAFLLSVR